MTTTVTPKLCMTDGCSRPVLGRAKLCTECATYCECGRRRNPDRPRCRRCSARITATEKKTAGRGDRPIVWVPNGRGTMVAKHLFVARR